MKNFCLIILFFISFAQAETISCHTVEVVSGDTFRCLTEQKEQIEVGLYQVAAPELKQNFGQEAKKLLSDLLVGSRINIDIYGKDKGQRVLGSIRVHKYIGCETPTPNTSDILVIIHPSRVFDCYTMTFPNLEMIQQGYAWYNPLTEKNPVYQQAEAQARQNKLGLWSQPDPVSPWVWRKQQQKKGTKK